jgi:glycine/D-amino acid oxidase-like deaminating enzyme
LNAFGKNPAPYHNFNRRSMDIWPRFARELGLDIGLHWGGEMRWECTPEGAKELRQRIQQLQAWGYPSRMIDAAELCACEPGLVPGPVTAAAFGEIDGQVEPSKVIAGCLHRARERGAAVHLDTPVTGWRLDATRPTCRRVQAVQTPQGELMCDAVVVASGTGTTALAAMADIHLPQQVSPGVVVRTEPLPRRILHHVSVLHTPPISEERPAIHLRQGTDGTVMIGEGTQESLHRDDSQAHADDLMARAAHYLPVLAGVRALPVPVGYRPMPLDGFPVLGFTAAVANLYIAVMHRGVTLAPLVGALASMEIVDGARVEMLAPYRPERFAQH